MHDLNSFVNSLEGFVAGLVILATVIAVFVGVNRLGEIRDELREQSRLLRASGADRQMRVGDANVQRWARVPGGRGGIRLDDPAES